MHGALIKSSDNYSTIEKKYKFYVQGATFTRDGTFIQMVKQ